MKIKGVIFDMDGTLFDTEKIKLQTWIEIIEQYGHSVTEEEFAKKYIGGSLMYVANGVIEQFNLQDEVTPEELIKQKENISFKKMRDDGVDLMPYAQEAIEFFNIKDTKMGIATGSVRDEVEIKLSQYPFDKYFGSVVTQNDVENKKPHPETYKKALEELSLNPDNTIAFEDSESGFKSARDAGLTVFVIPTEHTKDHNFEGADGRFDNLRKAIEFIREDDKFEF